jgi:hypothetical protein
MLVLFIVFVGIITVIALLEGGYKPPIMPPKRK